MRLILIAHAGVASKSERNIGPRVPVPKDEQIRFLYETFFLNRETHRESPRRLVIIGKSPPDPECFVSPADRTIAGLPRMTGEAHQLQWNNRLPSRSGIRGSANLGIKAYQIQEPGPMIETPRSDFPVDMMRAAESPALGSLECLAYDALDRLKHYARDHPTEFGLWALGVGFILGWKLKPW